MPSTSYYQNLGWVINPNTGLYEPPRGNPDSYAIGFSGAQRPDSSVYSTSINEAIQNSHGNNGWNGDSAWTLWNSAEHGSAWIPPTTGTVSAEANNAAVAATLGLATEYKSATTNKGLLVIAALAAYFIFK